VRAIVEGRVYDTSTAEKLFSYNNSRTEGGKYKASEQTLYRTARGSYFLLLESRISGDQKIVPLDKEDMFIWVGRFVTGKEHEELCKLIPELIA
jgi:hypothetical protein